MSPVSVAPPSYLLDVSTLIGLGVRQHQFHHRVATWLETKQFFCLFTCPTTELGFIRILTQVPAYGTSYDQAHAQLAQLKANPRYSIRFLSDDQEASGLPHWVRNGSQTTDGHLLQLATANGASLATLDTRIPGAFVIP